MMPAQRPFRQLLAFLLLLPLGLQVSHAGQEQIRLYEKTFDDGQIAIWTLVANYYAPNAANEPQQAGDFIIPFRNQGAQCDPDTGVCHNPLGSPNEEIVRATPDDPFVISRSDCNVSYCQMRTESRPRDANMWVFPAAASSERDAGAGNPARAFVGN